jgi:hypothetical protein
MTQEIYEQIRTKLLGGYKVNPLVQLLKDRAGIRGPIRGTPEEFSQIVYELANGHVDKRNETVSYQILAKGKRDVLKFGDGSLFSVVKTRGLLGGSVIVITPYPPAIDDLLETREMPLDRLVFDSLMLREIYANVAYEYQREEHRMVTEKAATEARLSRESRLESVLETVEKAKSGTTVMIRGLPNVDALVDLGFVPSLVNNPDNWIDAEDFPGLRYRHARSGIEVLLTARERFRPIEELNRLEFTFLVHRSDDDPTSFKRMLDKFRVTTDDGPPYSMKSFHEDLITLVKYPEELKGRTEDDLGLMADEVELVIDRRQELDKGILPYEAVFNKDTQAIIDHILKNGIRAGEIRKALDYYEYTGIVDPQYKATLHERITAATETHAGEADGLSDILYDKRIKEIVMEVLKKIPKEKLTSSTITMAMAPYVRELGFGKLIKIRERILQLKEMVHSQGT